MTDSETDVMNNAWTSGSYPAVAPNYAPIAGRLVERVGVSSDDTVLDIGCGTGTVAVAAARRDARVTGLDITPPLLAEARTNADVAGVDVDWRRGDAADLPLDDDAFDATLSNLGHMYGTPPDAAARELTRVTRPGGRIGFTSWTPSGLYPALAGVLATVLPPDALPDVSEPPFMWGDRGTVRERLGEVVESVEFETGTVRYPALSPEHFWEHTAATSGTFVELLDAVDESDRPTLDERMVETVEPHFDDREHAVELEYLLTTARVAGAE